MPCYKEGGQLGGQAAQSPGYRANPLGHAKSEGILDLHDPIRASTAGNYRYNFPGSMVKVPRRQFRPPVLARPSSSALGQQTEVSRDMCGLYLWSLIYDL